MLPHPYALDSLSKSQDIASSILTATSSSQISTIIASIEAFLKSHSPDQSRHFFSLTFPTLICKLFGFDHSNSSSNAIGWIDTVNSSNDSHLSNLLFSLLSPNGPLFNSISAVDRLSLVKYVFPLERLPEWSRYLLCNNKDDSSVLSDLCALFRDKVKHDCQIQLNVFEYYFLWFAYYPVCKGNSEALGPVSVKRDRRFRLENWTGLLNANKRGVERKVECDLYLRLLYAYLRAFVPVYDVNSHQPYRGSLLHYYPLGYEGSGMVRGEFLVDAFVHFWLVDNDFSPLPVNVCKSFGISFQLRSALGEMPPTSGLGEVVKLFVRYLNCSAVAAIEGHEGGEYCGSPRLGTNGSLDTPKSKEVTSRFSSACLLGYWNPWMQRPLYRFLLRTFLFCPVATSVKNASQVFDVWISYMEPWARNSDDFSELDAITTGPATNERKENSLSRAGVYTPQWQDYVVSNYLYYSSLVMHFIGFAHRFLHSDVEIIVQMVLKVLDTLTSSKELIDLLKNVDTLFHSKQAGSSKSMANNLYRYIPIIREQLQDWEDGLCETDADGSFLHENWNKDLRLFAEGEDGGQQLLQLFILRAEAELQAMSGDNPVPSLQCVDSLKARLGSMFDGQIMKSTSTVPEPRQHQQSHDEIFKPRRAGKHAITDFQYKGDWMNRPISNDEIAWLAKLLIWMSAWLNDSLGLNQAESSQGDSGLSYVELTTDVTRVCGPSEALKVFFCAVGSWLLFLGGASLGLMRKYGLRINLRILASKKVAMVLILYAVFSSLKKLVRAF